MPAPAACVPSHHHQAITSTRKGNKKLAIYDLKITMRWEAQGEEDAEQVGGVNAAAAAETE